MGSDDVRAKVARTILRASEIREASWDGGYTYRKSNSQAAEEACKELGTDDWYPIIACLATAGYAEMFEWAERFKG